MCECLWLQFWRLRNNLIASKFQIATNKTQAPIPVCARDTSTLLGLWYWYYWNVQVLTNVMIQVLFLCRLVL